MTSMFPGPGRPDRDNRPGPSDYNRLSRASRALRPDNGCPRALRAAYWVLLAAAIIMLTTGMVSFLGTGAPVPEAPEFLRTNRITVGVVNTVGAILMAIFATQLPQGSLWARRICVIVAALTLFTNVAALALGIGGITLIITPILLVIALLLLFRPESTTFLREA